MKRKEWQRIAEERARDAEVLLNAGRRSGAYYLAGYAVECGLKSCVRVFLKKNPDIIFREKGNLYSQKCWTHDIEDLVTLAHLNDARDADTKVNPALAVNWHSVKDWSEKVRYRLETKQKAKRLYEAVTHDINGVLPWIRNRW